VNIAFNKRLLVVWLVLALLTVSYPWIDQLADRNGVLHASAILTVVAIVIAVVKMRIIFREFMEVRHAPPLLARLTDLWVVLIALALLGSYFAGLAVR
jgi:hypothetical protein